MDIVVDDDEAPIVKKIFEMTVKEGYGSYRMADYLNSHGIRTHNNSKFQCNTVNRILKNKLYCGYLVSGGVESPYIERLHIIDENIFEQAQFILKQRSSKMRKATDSKDYKRQYIAVRKYILCSLRSEDGINKLYRQIRQGRRQSVQSSQTKVYLYQ